MEEENHCLETPGFYLTARRLRLLKLVGAGSIFVLLAPSQYVPGFLSNASHAIQTSILNAERVVPDSLMRSPLLTASWTLAAVAAASSSSVVLEFIFSPRLFDRVKLHVVDLLYKWVPSVRQKIDSDLSEAVVSMKKSVLKPMDEVFTSLPSKGLTYSEVDAIIARRTANEREGYASGKVSGAVYFVDEAREAYLASVQGRFGLSNPLHPEMFPAVRQMEAEVCRMLAEVFRGVVRTPAGAVDEDRTAAGCVTSGGTESLLMMVKAYRDWGVAVRGIQTPEVVVSSSVHAALNKAEGYFNNVKLVVCDVDQETGEVLISQVRRAVNRNTVLIVGSAPSYPRGCMDNIPALAAIAKRNRIGMHVDCCLGSLIAPMQRHLSESHFRLPYEFDFSVEGVTSLSCDTHKFGLAPKGTSVLLYRDAWLRRYQFFTCTHWTGGIYASPSIAGSRAGSSIAAAWAALLTMGQSGYLKNAERVLTCSKSIAKILSTDPELRDEIALLGRCDSSVVSFKTTNGLPVYAVTEAMGVVGGWHLNNLQNPEGFHLCVTVAVAGEDPARKALEFCSDLKKAIAIVKADRENQLSKQGGAALYGMAATVPRGLVDRIAKLYFDVLMLIAPTKEAAAELKN